MCGLVGVWSWSVDSELPERARLIAARDLMRTRGPDGHGDWTSPCRRVFFGHRRLSLLDLSDAGAQPMSDTSGRFVIVFNGEIYNFRELRAELVRAGVRMKTQCDTEVLVEGFAFWGEAVFNKVRGMFAVAIWDSVKRELVLARDPLGIKPLYVCSIGGRLAFASTLRTLTSLPFSPKSVDPLGLASFYLWGSVQEPRSIVGGIKMHKPGVVTTYDDEGRSNERQFWQLETSYNAPLQSTTSVGQDLAESIQAHLTADVPIGLFLSAGIDSAALLAMCSQYGGQTVKTLTLRFEEFAGTVSDETPGAEWVARHYGASHTTYTVTRSEYERLAKRFFGEMEQPTIDGLNTYLVAQAAHATGIKASLSGVGADELFCGYPSFRNGYLIDHARSLVDSLDRSTGVARNLLRQVGAPWSRLAVDPSYGSAHSLRYFAQRGLFLPEELDDLMGEELGAYAREELRLRNHAAVSDASVVKQTALAEQSRYLRNQLLRDTDWTGMSHSHEIRTPFVDSVLHRRCASSTLNAFKKRGDKKMLSDIARLPTFIANRRKTGFSVPHQLWSRGSEPSNEHWSRTLARRVGKSFGTERYER
ncbi:MAG: asparagine synthase (glutamine-hydrolyzing) [Myxococcota bacterium]